MTALEAARNTLYSAQDARAALLRDHATATAAHESAIRALGPEPRVNLAPDAPESPTVMRPIAADADAARDNLVIAPIARERHRRYLADLTAAEADVATCTAAATASAAAAAEVVRALAAVREAPTEALRASIDTLGDTGPLVITLPPRTSRQSPRVVPCYRHEDGSLVPASDASSGEREILGAHLAAAIRRGAARNVDRGFATVPVCVDHTLISGGTGDLPAIPGVLWVERSTSGAGLEVGS